MDFVKYNMSLFTMFIDAYYVLLGEQELMYSE